MQNNILFETRLISSLEKVFADGELSACEWSSGSMLCNEVYSFQVAYRSVTELNHIIRNVDVKIVSELSPWITVREVGLVPSEMPNYADHDDNVLRTAPGLYPDILKPLDTYGLTVVPGQWRALWITVNPKGKASAGRYPVEICFTTVGGDELGSGVFELDVLDGTLPAQKVIQTQWLHTDCIAEWYKVDVFSEGYWGLVEKYIRTAVEHGINMILTPIFTPPLDTYPGGERPTVQLVDVEKKGDSYKFSFQKLERWVEMCVANGVEYFELSHLFTQWGAKHAPKIIAVEDGEEKRIFGWETDAAGYEYKKFLEQFLPELVRFIKGKGIEERSYFHVSDEPGTEHLESYSSAVDIIKKHTAGFPVIDALSNYEFYETGLVKKPVAATDHIRPFLENNVPGLWAYYCCGQYKQVSNCFFSMPSARNRILGMQLYKFNISGFLHWGYNFWNSVYSFFPINPFVVTDAVKAYPSGDAFLVYPGEEGPLESIRLEVLREAFQDIRALELLEGKIGRDAVMDILDEGLEETITFDKYPRNAEWLLRKREQFNERLRELCTKTREL